MGDETVEHVGYEDDEVVDVDLLEVVGQLDLALAVVGFHAPGRIAASPVYERGTMSASGWTEARLKLRRWPWMAGYGENINGTARSDTRA